MNVIGGKLDRALDRASGARTVRFARAEYATPAGGFTPMAYRTGDAEGFGAAAPPALAQASVSGAIARAPRRPAMSQVLGAIFGGDPAAAPKQVRRAYDKLKAFGL